MFYKDNFNKEGKDLIKNNPLEFAIVLANKFKIFPEYVTGYLKATDKDGKENLIKPVIYNIENESYLTENGERMLNKYSLQLISKTYPDLTDFCFIQKDISTLTGNPSVMTKMQNLLDDFFNIKVDKDVIDKNGHKYNIKIVKNADDNIGNSLIVDTLYLYDNDKKVGYLKAKYTKEQFIKSIYGDKDCNDSKLDKNFIDTATTDFSRIRDEYQNKGLGYVMYFHMAQYLENEGIKFRSSTLQTPLAARLWDGINKNWGDYTKIKNFNNNMCCFIKMTKDLELYFENKIPKIKSVKFN